MARIELLNLHKSFGAVQAVKNLTLNIEDCEFVVLVGPSGCGKTTTLRMIAGFEDPTSGEIRIDGRVVNDLEPRDRGLGMVFQSHALFPHKNVAQNIEFGLRMKKMQGREDVWEMTWAPDGRATFHFGNPVAEGEPHIVWVAIGTHDIL